MTEPPAYITVELHCHTYHSPDCLMLPERMLQVCQRRGIDRLAITDHNQIAGAREAAALDPVRVIPGEEVMTTKGEVIAWFVKERVPPGLPPAEAIGRLREQGAVISVPHPLDPVRSASWAWEDLKPILPLVDALEVYNARSWAARHDERARALAKQHGLLATAGSDAHAYPELGRAAMRMPAFDDAATFREALAQAEIIARRSSPLVHFYSRYATLRKALGWRRPPRPMP